MLKCPHILPTASVKRNFWLHAMCASTE